MLRVTPEPGRAILFRHAKAGKEQRRDESQPEASGRRPACRCANAAQILRAAKEIFAAKGFDGTRIAEIAERAGLPKANVYDYFPGKAAIYRAIIDDLLRGWNAALDCIDPEREPQAAIAAYVRAKLEHSRREPTEAKIFASETIRGARFLSRADRAAILAITRRKSAVIEGWIAAGKLRPVDPRHFFILLWSATQFYAEFDVMARMALETNRLRTQDFEAAAATITQIVLHGCGMPANQSGAAP